MSVWIDVRLEEQGGLRFRIILRQRAAVEADVW